MPKVHANNIMSPPEEKQNSSCQDAIQHPDELMEEILQNINHTPLGQILKRIASLPEVRKGKVLRLRQQLIDGTYDVGDRLDAALDRVLEELTTPS
jgi:hypothetical protein